MSRIRKRDEGGEERSCASIDGVLMELFLSDNANLKILSQASVCDKVGTNQCTIQAAKDEKQITNVTQMTERLLRDYVRTGHKGHICLKFANVFTPPSVTVDRYRL